MRRVSRSLFLAAVILVFGCLAAACGSNVKGAIASLAPSRSASVPAVPTAAPTDTPTLTPPTVTVTTTAPTVTVTTTIAPPSTQSAASPTLTAQPSGSPAAASGPASQLLWLWILLGALILIGLIVWITRAAGRRSAAAASWRSRVVNAYAAGSALYDAMSVAESPGALAAGDAAARWADIQRRADDLAQMLYAMREAAPDEDALVRVTDVLTALQVARSAMDAERAAGGAGAQYAEATRSRLRSFEASLRALRAPYESMP